MSLDLGNLLQSQVGNVLGQFLTANGESAENSTQAAGLAVPAVIAGLVKHIGGDAGNASGLLDLITGASGARLNNALADVSSGSGAGGLIDLGKELLPKLMNGSAADVADQISAESGISKASSGSLLALAMPLVLAVLRGKAQSDNLSGGQLLGLLGQQQGWLSNVLSGNMLSALGIGSLSGLFGGLSNIIGSFGSGAAATASAAAVAAAAPAAAKGGAGKWIVLGLAVLAGLFAFKSCGQKEEPAASAPVEAAASAASAESEGAVLADASAASEPAASETMPAASVASETSAPAASEASPVAAPASEAAPAAADANARVVVEDGVAKFYFATGKNDIADGAETVVADVIAAGKEGKKLVISGFADSTGNAAANEALSKKRAQAVQAFFEAQGVSAANIELRKPESTTGAVGNEQEGRRVEVKVEG